MLMSLFSPIFTKIVSQRWRLQCIKQTGRNLERGSLTMISFSQPGFCSVFCFCWLHAFSSNLGALTSTTTTTSTSQFCIFLHLLPLPSNSQASFPISPSIMEPKQKVSFFRHEKEEEYMTKQERTVRVSETKISCLEKRRGITGRNETDTRTHIRVSSISACLVNNVQWKFVGESWLCSLEPFWRLLDWLWWMTLWWNWWKDEQTNLSEKGIIVWGIISNVTGSISTSDVEVFLFASYPYSTSLCYHSERLACSL